MTDNKIITQAKTDPTLLDYMLRCGIDPATAGIGELTTKLEAQDRWLLRFVTVDSRMQELKDQVRKLASLNIGDHCLILGETGTGKELLANALHGLRAGKFIAINCAGIPRELIESELFGHKKGAFTGAYLDKRGMLEEANGGTIFLDEIGEMDIGLQSKLLRATETMRVKRIGENEERAITCRIVGATNKAIDRATLFRSDLYYRLSVFELRTLPLRDRFCDVLPIVASLLKCSEAEVPLNWHEAIDNVRALDNLLPGNVRQLQKLVRRYQVLGQIPNRKEDWL